MWKLLSGRDSGVTHVSSTAHPDLDSLVLWEHPLDLWMSTPSIQQWPSLVFKVGVGAS